MKLKSLTLFHKYRKYKDICKTISCYWSFLILNIHDKSNIYTNQKNHFMKNSIYRIVLAVFLFFAAAPNVITAQVNLQEGLIIHYAFSGDANDESGNGWKCYYYL